MTRLTRLVESVLDLSRLEAGVAAPRTEVWEVDDLLAQAVSEVAATDRVRVGDVAGLPPVAVDAAQIQRVLVNVLDNALKYSVAEVDVLAHADGAVVHVEVLDEGGAAGRASDSGSASRLHAASRRRTAPRSSSSRERRRHARAAVAARATRRARVAP